MKWFDLADNAAKLERLRTAPGHHVLRLEMSSESPVLEGTSPDELEMYGWITKDVEDGKISFENHRAILKAADVAQSLLAFWPEQIIRRSHTPIDQLVQGERVEGLKTRDMATMADFQQDMLGVEPDDLARITASILRAQSKVQEIEKRGVSQPLDGRGLEIATKINDVAGPELAVAAVLEATRSHKTPALTEALLAVADAETDNLGQLVAKVEALVPDRVTEMVRSHVDRFMATDQIMTNGKGDRFNAALGMFRLKVPLAALEEIRNSPKSTQELEEDLGMTVRRDKSLPTAQYRHSLISMRASLEAMAEALNRDPKSLVPGQRGVVLRVSRKSPMADENKGGVAISIGGEDGDDDLGAVSAMGVSAVFGGTFVHETGHQVDRSFNLTVEERKDILEQSGVRGRVFRAVRDALDSEWIDEKGAAYLRSDEEIFARTFEAAIVNRALQNGDRALASIGGFSAGAPTDRHAPFGDYQLTEKFLTELNQVLDQKQALKHEKRRVATTVVEP